MNISEKKLSFKVMTQTRSLNALRVKNILVLQLGPDDLCQYIHNLQRDCYLKIGIRNRVFGKGSTHVKTARPFIL